MSEIQDQVKKIVIDHLGIDEIKVVPEAKFIDDWFFNVMFYFKRITIHLGFFNCLHSLFKNFTSLFTTHVVWFCIFKIRYFLPIINYIFGGCIKPET